MAEFRTDGGGVLCEDLVRKVFEYDGHAEEARAACIAKGWGDVRRGPAWIDTTTGLRRWEKECRWPTGGYAASADCMSFSQDMVTLAVGSYSSSDSKVKLFDVATGKLQHWCRLSTDLPLRRRVLAAGTCSHGILFLTATDILTNTDKPPRIYSIVRDVELLQCELDLYGFRYSCNGAPIQRAAFSSDGRILAVARYCRDIMLFDVATGKLLLKKRAPATP